MLSRKKKPLWQGHWHLGFAVTTNMSPLSHPSWFIRRTIMWDQMDITLLIPIRMDVWTQVSTLNLGYCSSINTAEKGQGRVKLCDKMRYLLQEGTAGCDKSPPAKCVTAAHQDKSSWPALYNPKHTELQAKPWSASLRSSDLFSVNVEYHRG